MLDVPKFRTSGLRPKTRFINLMAADLSQDVLRKALSGQYHVAMGMLRYGITQCPDEMWDETESVNEIWQLGYHTLYFAHMYLMDNYNMTFEQATMWLYIIASGCIIVGLYMYHPRKFKKYLRKLGLVK